MDNFADFLTKMANTKGENGSLLDETIVLMGSNLGRASSHDTRDLPIVVAGGGFEHGAHIQGNANPLNELFLSLTNNIEGVNMPEFKDTHQKFKHFS
jgi:hypothetical protein